MPAPHAERALRKLHMWLLYECGTAVSTKSYFGVRTRINHSGMLGTVLNRATRTTTGG